MQRIQYRKLTRLPHRRTRCTDHRRQKENCYSNEERSWKCEEGKVNVDKLHGLEGSAIDSGAAIRGPEAATSD